MSQHGGTLQRPQAAEAKVVIRVSDGKYTVVGAPGRWIGAWPLETTKFERLSLREFAFSPNGESWTFISDDPAAFAESVGVSVDLRPNSRFGLGDRVKQAREDQRAGR
jgi:hypothetical protein